jgi:hypothetical protein
MTKIASISLLVATVLGIGSRTLAQNASPPSTAPVSSGAAQSASGAQREGRKPIRPIKRLRKKLMHRAMHTQSPQPTTTSQTTTSQSAAQKPQLK